jgi:hypothetical protein
MNEAFLLAWCSNLGTKPSSILPVLPLPALAEMQVAVEQAVGLTRSSI